MAKDASASVGQVAGICNTASMRPPFSMTLSVAGTHGDGERPLNGEIRNVARFEANQTDQAKRCRLLRLGGDLISQAW